MTDLCKMLRNHLRFVHHNYAAADLSDSEAREQHWDEHHGPGGLRNHSTPTQLHDFRKDYTMSTTSPAIRSALANREGVSELPEYNPPAPKRYPVTTGELRSKLQPVVFMTLNEAISNPNGADLPTGSLVSVQFWAPGKVVVTAAGDGKPVMVDDRLVNARWYPEDSNPTVTTAELHARLQPVVFAYLVEQVIDNSDGSTLETGEQVAVQFHGGGMTALTNVRTGEQVVARTNTIHVAWNPFDLP
jgi:hypothetical protein